MTKRELAAQIEQLRALLAKVQWRGDGYTCVGCGAMHRDGCRQAHMVITRIDARRGVIEAEGRPGCEVDNALNPSKMAAKRGKR